MKASNSHTARVCCDKKPLEKMMARLRRLRGVATAERRLVEDNAAPTVLQDRVGCREARKTAANDDALVCREDLCHLKDAKNARLEPRKRPVT